MEDTKILDTSLDFATNNSSQLDIYNNIILEYILNTSNDNIIEPTSSKEVLLTEDKDLHLQAMQLEINDLLKSNTRKLVIKPNEPANNAILKGRWVLKKI